MSVKTALKIYLPILFIAALFAGCANDPDSQLMSALRRADYIYYGDNEEADVQSAVERIHDAVAKGADPNMNYEGLTPLLVAIKEDDTELAALLLDRGADVSARDLNQDGYLEEPPLVSAINSENATSTDMIELLISAGATVEREAGFQPLSVAVETGSLDRVKVLLQAGADPNGYEEWESPLELAVGQGSADIVDALLSTHAKVRDSAELLTFAAGSADPEVFNMILPLHSGSKESLRLFGSAAWGLHDENEARKAGAGTILEQLRTAGIKPAPDEFDEHMASAAQSLDAQALETMMAYGASPNATNESGESCLMLAIEAASVGRMMESDIGLKGMFDYQDTDVKSILQLLLEHNSDINAQDSHGRTALMGATTSFNVTAVRLLLEHGADQSLVDENGQNAAQLMLSSRLLLNNKADTAGRMMMAFVGITPEFLRKVRVRAEQVLAELKSDGA